MEEKKEKRKCKGCGILLKPKEGKKEIDPRRRFCDYLCRGRFIFKKIYWEKYRDDPIYLHKKKRIMREWYKKNKERQHENIKDYYEKNKERFFERGFVAYHRKKILRLLKNTPCVICKKRKIKEIHHTKYDFPKKLNGKSKKEMEIYLKEYVKFLIPFCSRDCHRRYERNISELNTFK